MSFARRRFLTMAIAALAGVSRSAHADVSLAAPVAIGRLRVPGLADPRPQALPTLLTEVRESTSVDPADEIPWVDPEPDALAAHPFLVLAGDKAFDPIPDKAAAALRLWLREGGFLFIDDATGTERSDFDRCVRRDLERILPGSKLRPVGREHAVYRSFFLMRTVAGRVDVQPYLEGIWFGDITPVLYSRNDLLGAIERTSRTTYARDVIPGGARQRREARKLAINLVLFALTSNYKKDAVHVETLLERIRRTGGYRE